MDSIEQLRALGFGDYEARAYAALLRHGAQTGYELARTSGVPRANIYAVLDRLEERGAVLHTAAPNGTRYGPVPADEVLRGLSARYDAALSAAETSLAALGCPASADQEVWSGRGYPTLLALATGLVETAESSLLISLWPEEAAALAEPLAKAAERQVDLTTLCPKPCSHTCAACRGQVYHYRLVPEPSARWLVVVRDGVEMLAGAIGPGESATLVRTRQRLLVDLTTWYIRHSIGLAAVLAACEPAGMAPEVRAALHALGPQPGDAGWLADLSRWQ